jgi:hypothetical protein
MWWRLLVETFHLVVEIGPEVCPVAFLSMYDFLKLSQLLTISFALGLILGLILVSCSTPLSSIFTISLSLPSTSVHTRVVVGVVVVPTSVVVVPRTSHI